MKVCKKCGREPTKRIKKLLTLGVTSVIKFGKMEGIPERCSECGT